jgi:hypothetical protein
MKTKDLLFLVLAVIIMLVAGYVGFTQILGKKTSSSSGVQVEVIGNIPSSFDGTALAQLNDPTKVKDFNAPIDFGNLGNTSPFGK